MMSSIGETSRQRPHSHCKMKDRTGRLNEVEPRISMKKNSIQNTRQYIIVCKRHERYVLSKIVVDFKGYIQTIRYFALLIYKRLSAFPFQNIFYLNHVFDPKLFIILPIKQLINKSNFEHSERR